MESQESWHYPNGMDSLVEMNHSPGEFGGIVVDEGIARATPCKCFALPSGKEMCFSKGIVGAITDEGQKALYCQEKEIVPMSPEQAQRMEQWKEAVTTCQTEIQPVPHEQRLSAYLQCMSREASSRGFKL